MKTNLFFVLFALASILFGLGAESKNITTALFGLAFMVLAVIVAMFIFEPQKR